MTQPNAKTYNGWTNWATWNVALWFANDEGLYHSYSSLHNWRTEDTERHVRYLMPTGTPDMDSAADYNEVNWEEITDAWNED